MTETDYSKLTKPQLVEELERRDHEPVEEVDDERIRTEARAAALEDALALLTTRMPGVPDTRSLDERMAAVQLELEDVPRAGHAKVKTKSGAEYEYDYILEADLMKAIRPLLAKHGIATYYADELVAQQAGASTVRVSLTFAANGDERTLTADGYATDTGDKGPNKAKTSAVRYILWKTFLQPSDEDDGERDSVDPVEAAKAHEGRERADQIRRGDQTRRTDRPTEGQTTGALVQRISQRSVELDEVHGLTPGLTLGKLQKLIADAHDGRQLADLDAPDIVKIGQALANHVATERDALDRGGLDFTPTEFRLP